MIARLLVFMLLLFVALLRAQTTYNATSCENTVAQDDVQDAVNMAVNGDTVVIPAGACTWTARLLVNAGIAIKGESEAGTVITDNITAADNLITVNIETGETVKITNFTIVSQKASDSVRAILINGTGDMTGHPKLIMTNITINGYSSSTRDVFMETKNVIGVVSNITWSGGFGEFLNIDFPAWEGVGTEGHNSWSAPTDFGSDEAIYIESSTFYNSSGSPQSLIEGDEGTRYVARFNNFSNYMTGGHGTESGGHRGIRKVETYFNQYDARNISLDRQQQIRSGTLLFFGNSLIDSIDGSPGLNTRVKPWINRSGDILNFGYADGTGLWDLNTGSTLVYSGTADAGTTTDTLVDAEHGWGADEFESACYVLRDITAGKSGYIHTNTPTSVTTLASSAGNPHTYAEGDSYQIRTCPIAFDQPGRGQSTTLLSGSGSAMTPQQWPGDALEPIYEWLNTGGTPALGVVRPLPPRWLAPNVDYYTYTASFDGTAGVGSGARASRPETCTPGVAWWSTDQGGNWNTTNGDANDGTLDKCTATDTWTNGWYTPYQYPHPDTIESSPDIVSSIPPNVQPRAPYSYTFTATGGTTPYNWAITAGALPPGLTLNATTGELAGRTQIPGTYNITVQVTDDMSATDSEATSITVGSPPKRAWWRGLLIFD